MSLGRCGSSTVKCVGKDIVRLLPPPLQFMLIFHYAKEGTLRVEGLKTIAATCDVTTEGVGGAKSFFEAKAQQVCS